MKSRKGFVVILTVLTLVVAEPHRFDNHRMYRLRVERDEQLQVLKSLKTGQNSYEYFDEPRQTGQELDIIIPPTLQSEFETILKDKEFSAKLVINNLQDLVDRERPQTDDGEFGWDAYHSVDTINAWLYSLEEQYPEVTVIKGGSTYEGREILGVNINRNPEQNPGVFIESQIYANEWLASASTTWIINKLLTATEAEPEIKDIADNINWYIFPLINADGYEYSRNVYRLWKKTRSKQGFICNGVDANRNWDVNWEKGGIGSAANMCEEKYAGPTVFSEVETRTLSEYILSIREHLGFYLAFHSAGNALMFPWGHTRDRAPDYFLFFDIALATANAISIPYGTFYRIDSAYVFSPTTGGSTDWALNTLGIPGFTYKFRDRNPTSGAQYGVLAPPEEIQPNAEEVLHSLITLVQKATAHGYLVFRN
ncbi:zinc carboxypeptidase-like [Sergentomyia squamirostris]